MRRSFFTLPFRQLHWNCHTTCHKKTRSEGSAKLLQYSLLFVIFFLSFYWIPYMYMRRWRRRWETKTKKKLKIYKILLHCNSWMVCCYVARKAIKKPKFFFVVYSVFLDVVFLALFSLYQKWFCRLIRIWCLILSLRVYFATTIHHPPPLSVYVYNYSP